MSSRTIPQRIAIIGFGKIGQGIAAAILRAGLHVQAIDQNADLLASLRSGDSFRSNEPEVQPIFEQAFGEERLLASTDLQTITNCAAILISIPLGVNESQVPDPDGFVRLLTGLAPFVRDRVLLVIETSVPVGFCRKTVLGTLGSLGREHGTDFLLCHSPERIKSGSMLQQLASIPKIIGGVSQEATMAAIEIYRAFIPVELLRPVQSLEEAEFAKMAGMLYRDINIALANQLSLYASAAGLDLPSLIPLINADNEANLLQPGIGVGGHCTPVYPWFLIRNFEEAGLNFSLAKESRAINDGMAAARLSDLLMHVPVKRALLLGLSFRPGVQEDSNSPAFGVRAFLESHEFEVLMHDPLYGSSELEDRGWMPAADPYASGAGLLVLVTMHPSYAALDWNLLHAEGISVVLDGRNVLPRERIEAAGIRYYGMGR